jgi:hypothetical protein
VSDPASRPRIELLGAQHDRAGFICGNDALDTYFQRQITQDARRHLATPFVMIMPDDVIGGFYTLSSTALRLHELPADIAKRLPRYPLVPATLIGRLALGRRLHGQGWGSFLLLARAASLHRERYRLLCRHRRCDRRGACPLPACRVSAAAGFTVPPVLADQRHRGAL